MRLKFWGVRGSRPTHKVDLLGFGGNSTSLEFMLDFEDFYLFLDGGSGLAHRGRALGETTDKKKFFFLVTHTHWDHILGFPFFHPFYNPDNQVTIYASKMSTATFSELFFGLQSSKHLPVPVDQMKAKVNFQSLNPGEKFSLEGKVDVSTYQINHQAITLAYRLDYRGGSVAVVTDNAPIEKNYLGEGMKEKAKDDPAKFESEFNAGLIAFLKDCHVVVFDTHFTEANLKADWGHSTPQRALQFCIQAGVKKLILFHHAPEDTDSQVYDKIESVRAAGKAAGVVVVAAREGDEWDTNLP